MTIEERIELLLKLREYILSGNDNWKVVEEKASYENPWFIPDFITYQLNHIATEYLSAENLDNWISKYNVPQNNKAPKNVGVVMAGNIPLAGFHDFLSVFISGHRQTIKPSSKDFQLIKGITDKLKEWNSAVIMLCSPISSGLVMRISLRAATIHRGISTITSANIRISSEGTGHQLPSSPGKKLPWNFRSWQMMLTSISD
jgi:hypothetical protein